MICKAIYRFIFASVGGIFLTSCFLLAVAAGAYAQDQPKSAPAGRVLPTVFIYVDYNKKMHANISSIEDMVAHLQENLQQRISEKGYATAVIQGAKDFKRNENHYLLTINLDDYHGGPRKTVFIHYELSGPGIPVLMHDKELNTVKGSSKLFRVLAKELADIVDDRLQTRK